MVKPCRYGSKCYRKNPQHFLDFSHPGDAHEDQPQPSQSSLQKNPNQGKSNKLSENEIERRDISLIKGALTSKSGWFAKLFDHDISSRWRQEALAQGANMSCFDQAVLELKSHNYHNRHGLAYLDDLVPESLRTAIAMKLKEIEARPNPDFHPGSNGTVQNIIHPSLFPLVLDDIGSPGAKKKRQRLNAARSKSLGLGNVGEGYDAWEPRTPAHPLWHCSIHPLGEEDDEKDGSSYRWLPSEVTVDSQGKCTFTSYINNLSQTDAEDTTAPVTELSGSSSNTTRNRSFVDNLGSLLELFLPYLQDVIQDPTGTQPYPLRDKKLQVIVKSATYRLLPGQTYEGGWHVEGVPEERIIATAIYYLDTSPNTQGGSLRFRRMRNLNLVGDPSAGTYTMGDNSPDDDYLEWATDGDLGDVPTGFPKNKYTFSGEGKDNSPFIWRVSYQLEETPNHVEVDTIPTLQNRCLFFKNSLQHRVERIFNSSSSDLATRRILLFWLVDPEHHITSTADIPPQQWETEVSPALSKQLLPFLSGVAVVVDLVLQYARSGMTTAEAKQHREHLMQERKYKLSKANNDFERFIRREYSFCEH